MDWKETVLQVSDKVFPGLNNKIDEGFTSCEVMSNLPLQMSLYFNVYFTPVWICVMLFFLNEKYSCFDELYRFIVVTIMVAVLIVEPLRLYLGYEGNLKDKIPELAGFWMLSLLLQFPLQGFLLANPYFQLNVVETVAQSVIFLLLCTQIVLGYFALKYTSAQQAIYFRIMKMRKNFTLSDFKNKYKMA